MNKILDLEEKIMDCWSITDHIKTTLTIIEKSNNNEDSVTNALIGINELYNTRFELLFESFEEAIHEYHQLKLNRCNCASPHQPYTEFHGDYAQK